MGGLDEAVYGGHPWMDRDKTWRAQGRLKQSGRPWPNEPADKWAFVLFVLFFWVSRHPHTFSSQVCCEHFLKNKMFHMKIWCSAFEKVRRSKTPGLPSPWQHPAGL